MEKIYFGINLKIFIVTGNNKTLVTMKNPFTFPFPISFFVSC